MSGAVPPLPPYAFMASTGTALPLTLLVSRLVTLFEFSG